MRRKTKYKIVFSKYLRAEQKGQAIFERTVSAEQLEMIFILCRDLFVEHNKKKSGNITFIFPGDEDIMSSITAKNIPLWICKKFLPQREWRS